MEKLKTEDGERDGERQRETIEMYFRRTRTDMRKLSR